MKVGIESIQSLPYAMHSMLSAFPFNISKIYFQYL